MTYNILHGATTKNDFNLDAIAKVITDLDPDFVALQEVDFKTNRAHGYDLPTELGYRTKMASIYATAMPYDGGYYGEGVLSKYPFISTYNHPLPHHVDHEPRAALSTFVLTPKGDTIQFIGTHLDHLNNSISRRAQAKKLVELFSNSKYPTVLAGDLNATPESPDIQIILSAFEASDIGPNFQKTYSSSNPTKKIDYIMYDMHHSWRVIKTEVICDEYVTDHCYYYVDIILENN